MKQKFYYVGLGVVVLCIRWYQVKIVGNNSMLTGQVQGTRKHM